MVTSVIRVVNAPSQFFPSIISFFSPAVAKLGIAWAYRSTPRHRALWSRKHKSPSPLDFEMWSATQLSRHLDDWPRI